MSTVPIFSVGTAGTKQAAQRADGQWFYRVLRDIKTPLRTVQSWGRWIECDGRPDHAWYDPRQRRARLPSDSAQLSTD